MSVQAALEFIHQARENQVLRECLKSVGADDGLARIAAVGADQGLEFTPEELRAAHAQDWRLRWQYYHKRHEFQEFSRMSNGPETL